MHKDKAEIISYNLLKRQVILEMVFKNYNKIRIIILVYLTKQS